jgi:hypothetical protein
VAKRAVQRDGIEHPEAEPRTEPRTADAEPAGLLELQRQAGNAAVSRMLAGGAGGGTRRLARWVNLGTESWKIPGFTERSMTVWTGTKSEWSGRMDDIDDQDEFEDDMWGFLEASNDPGIVGRTRPPSHISNDPARVNYQNTIKRAPSQSEKLAFLEALYEKAGDLDLWHGGAFEGGPWLHYADKDLATFIAENQGLYLAAKAAAGERMSTSGLTAVAEQGGRQATMAMITNGGATAHKGVDLVMTANRKEGREKEIAKAQANQLVRNAAQTMRAALAANDARVAFERAVIGFVFDQVWEMIPGGGELVSAGKALLKAGLEKGLDAATKDDGPGDQVETINDNFVKTCNGLVSSGHIDNADAQDAILSFEAGIR